MPGFIVHNLIKTFKFSFDRQQNKKIKFLCAKLQTGLTNETQHGTDHSIVCFLSARIKISIKRNDFVYCKHIV